MDIGNTSLIYNSMNYDAVLAAAILRHKFPGIEVVDVAKQVPHDSETYVWIGVEPNAQNMYYYDLGKTKKHVVFLNRPDNVVASKKSGVDFTVLGPSHESYESMFEEDELPDPQFPPTLIDKVCTFYGIDKTDYWKLSMGVSMFHRRSTELEILAYVYHNLKEANQSLASHEPFYIKQVQGEEIKDYLEEARIIKKNLVNNYKLIPILDGDRVRMAVYTTINDFSIHLALRLIKLAHHNFMNMSLGLNGQIAYTNLIEPGFDKNVDKPLVIHS